MPTHDRIKQNGNHWIITIHFFSFWSIIDKKMWNHFLITECAFLDRFCFNSRDIYRVEVVFLRVWSCDLKFSCEKENSLAPLFARAYRRLIATSIVKSSSSSASESRVHATFPCCPTYLWGVYANYEYRRGNFALSLYSREHLENAQTAQRISRQ